jgi:hypothetical protein
MERGRTEAGQAEANGHWTGVGWKQDKLKLMDRNRKEAGQAEANGQR